METFLSGIGLFATALLLGSMAFFSAVMAPLVFIKLEAATAGAFIRQVFPWYYLVVIGLAVVGAFALAPVRSLDAIWLAGVAAVGVISRQMLMPRINADRDAVLAGDSSRQASFSRLHRLSVWINVVQLIIAAIVLIRFI
jgi:hypothetical protein